MLVKVLLHLPLALGDGPLLLEVGPITHQEVQRLERFLRLLAVARGLVDAPQGRLGEVHEVGQVLDLILLDLHADVVDLLRGDQRCETEDGRRLLLGHLAVPRTLRVHQQQRDLLPLNLPQEGLGPHPDPFCAVVHATFEAEAVGVVAAALYYGACGSQPIRHGVRRVAPPLWRGRPLCRAGKLALAGGLLLVAQVPEEQIQQERLPRSEGAHDGHDGHLLGPVLLEPLLEVPQCLFVHLDFLLLHVQLH
mmetsp:Transcript_39647/g.104609  ORF Transcript_39647/g.104609 Transcript_39647/m.104609 type:complete len:250 (+) Transcript_39647:1097-1846(+)